MADIVDIANDFGQISLDNAISHIQNLPVAAVAAGVCLECEKPVSSELRWCDTDCRDDWQRWNPGA